MRLLALALLLIARLAQAAPAWTLSWSDEFNGPANSQPDPKKWNYDLGGWGWGNGELQSYTNRPQNARMDGKGNLIIEARKEKFTGADKKACDYTSARLLTLGKFSQAYGRFEARLKIPKGQGIWPAFWMLGEDIGKNPWPACGEIDIMENIGKEPNIIHGTAHGPNFFGAQGLGAPLDLGKPYSDDFHIFAVEWEKGVLRWYMDGKLYGTRTPKDVPKGSRWVYDHPFFMIMNVAVGGGWPGNPDASTKFPQQMLVDYVRVYKAN